MSGCEQNIDYIIAINGENFGNQCMFCPLMFKYLETRRKEYGKKNLCNIHHFNFLAIQETKVVHIDLCSIRQL